MQPPYPVPDSTWITITALFQRSTLDDLGKAASSGRRNLRKFRNSAPHVPENGGPHDRLPRCGLRKFRNVRAMFADVSQCIRRHFIPAALYQRSRYFRKQREQKAHIRRKFLFIGIHSSEVIYCLFGVCPCGIYARHTPNTPRSNDSRIARLVPPPQFPEIPETIAGISGGSGIGR
jgi:hypothetical protein